MKVAALVEVWRQDDGLWRWRYLESDDHLVLESNESYSVRTDAERAAAVAYPGVPMIERAEAEPPTRPEIRPILLVLSVAVGFTVLAMLSAVLAVALALGVALRRVGRLAPRPFRR